VFEAGDAYYLPAGHVPAVAAGTEIVQLSHAAEMRAVGEERAENARKLQGG
jgi:hypothetical protein